MPFKSQAQRRKFAQLLVEGKISNQTFEEWNRETGAKNLPERVGPERRGRKNKTRTRGTRPSPGSTACRNRYADDLQHDVRPGPHRQEPCPTCTSFLSSWNGT